MIKIVLIEDNESMICMEERCIKDNWNLDEKMGLITFRSVEAFLEEDPEEFDILVLDIEFPGMTGIELVEQLEKEGKKCRIVFLTSYDRYAINSYNLSVKYYVLKEMMEERLPSVLQEIGEEIILRRQRYKWVESDGQRIKLLFDEIMYFFKEGKFVNYVTKESTYRERISLDRAEEELGGLPFLRIERGYVINVRYMKKLSEDTVQMTNGNTLPISRRMRSKVKKVLTSDWRKI